MKDTPPEIRKLQFDMMMNLGANRRIELASEMFMAARSMMLASMPPGLSEKEVKRRLYRKTYGEDLPPDFFKDEK